MPNYQQEREACALLEALQVAEGRYETKVWLNLVDAPNAVAMAKSDMKCMNALINGEMFLDIGGQTLSTYGGRSARAPGVIFVTPEGSDFVRLGNADARIRFLDRRYAW